MLMRRDRPINRFRSMTQLNFAGAEARWANARLSMTVDIKKLSADCQIKSNQTTTTGLDLLVLFLNADFLRIFATTEHQDDRRHEE